MPASHRQVTVKAYAKVNLDLRVLWRRPDGYHEIRTLFHTISLADTVRLRWERRAGTAGSRGLRVRTQCPGVDLPEAENLAHRAALAFGEAAGLGGELSIAIDKRIPAGGGLGGGSSDAAAVLLALAPLTGAGLTPSALLEVAASLGSDVPFFLMGGAAVGLGRGEELSPLPDLAPTAGLLIAPGIAVSTAEAYSALARKPPEASAKTQSFATLGKDFCGSLLASRDLLRHWTGSLLGCNDFEPAVFPRHPELAAWKQWLLGASAEHAMMSGSGSTVFGLFASADAARKAKDSAVSRKRLPLENPKMHLFRLLPRTRYQRDWHRRLTPYADPKLWPPHSNSL